MSIESATKPKELSETDKIVLNFLVNSLFPKVLKESISFKQHNFDLEKIKDSDVNILLCVLSSEFNSSILPGLKSDTQNEVQKVFELFSKELQDFVKPSNTKIKKSLDKLNEDHVIFKWKVSFGCGFLYFFVSNIARSFKESKYSFLKFVCEFINKNDFFVYVSIALALLSIILYHDYDKLNQQNELICLEFRKSFREKLESLEKKKSSNPPAVTLA